MLPNRAECVGMDLLMIICVYDQKFSTVGGQADVPSRVGSENLQLVVFSQMNLVGFIVS